MKAREWTIIVLLLSNVFLLCLLVAGRAPIAPAAAQTTASFGNFMALSAGADGKPTLFLIDTESKKMVVYQVVSGSRPLRLVAIRDMKYDFIPDDFNDTSGLSVEQLREYLSKKTGTQ